MVSRRAHRSRLRLLLAVSAACGLIAGCGGTAPRAESQPGPASLGTGSATWLFTTRALAQVAADHGVDARLHGARIYELVSAGQMLEASAPPVNAQLQADIVPTAEFPSYAALRQTLASGGLQSWIGAVLYDNEGWSFTPADEQRAPGRYMAMAGALVRRHHLSFLVSPGLTLTDVLAPGAAHRSAAYLQLGLAAEAARASGVVVIQAQNLERSAGSYGDFVRAAAAQARRVNSTVTLLAGVSSNPTGSEVSAGQLISAMDSASPHVDGYWMNIPARGPSCPRCGVSRPDIAIAAIRGVSR